MSGGFQTQVNVQPAIGVVGDFCDHNPRHSVDFGPFGAVAGSSGLTVGLFAWASYAGVDADGAPCFINNFGNGPVTGFIHREQQALITTYLADASMVVPAGYGVTVMSSGGYFVKNAGTTAAVPGQSCYADFLTGAARFAATTASSTSSGSIAAVTTPAFTGSISGNVLTVSAVSAGSLYPGTIIAGTNVATGTMIVSQYAGGTALGAGTYALNIAEQNIASEAMTGSYGTFTVGTATGLFAVGDTLSSTSTTAGTYITVLLTGTGGTGSTFVVTPSQAVTTEVITGATNVKTKWIAVSTGAAGEIVKISSQALG